MLKKTFRRRPSPRRHTLELLETRVMLTANWQNPVDPLDVDGRSDAVSPIDALLVINELNSPSVSEPGTGILPGIGDTPPPFFDVDGNGWVSPLDALLVINGMPESASDGNVGSSDFQPGNSVIVGMPAADGDGISHDTLINTFTRSKQRNVSVAANSDGDSVFVWSSLTQDGSGWGIFGQRYDNSGTKMGPEFQVNQHTRGTQWQPAVAMWEDGAFIATWSSAGQDGSGWGVFARMFNADGTPQDDEFRVNSHTRGTQNRPAVAVSQLDDDGEGSSSMAYIAWSGKGPGDNNGVFWTSVEMGRRTTTGDWLANSTTRGVQTHPSIAVSDGGLVGVSWQGRGDGDRNGIFMDLFASRGTSVLGETLVNNSTHSAEKGPSMAFAPGGSLAGESLAVAWRTHDGEPGAGVRVRTFGVMPSNSGGRFRATSSSVIQVNQTTKRAQKQPAVSYLNDSTFLVAWFGYGPGDRNGVFNRQFAADGTPLSDEALVNETTRALQRRPAVAAASNGYIIGWNGNGPADRHGVFARFVDTESRAPFSIDPIPNMTLDEGDTLSVTARVTFSNGEEPILFSFDNEVPTGATIDPVSGLITWVTAESDGGQSFLFDVAATGQESGFQDNDTFTVTVDEVNDGIQIEPIPDQEVTAGDTLMIPVTVNDPDGDAFTTSAMLADGGPLPSWLTYDETTLVFTAMPQDADVGTVMVTVTATDSGGANDMETFSITVLAIDTGFDFNVPAQMATVGELFAIDLDDFVTLTGTVDPGTITYVVTLSNGDPLPNWLMFNDTTNILAGIPAADDVGQLTIRAVATGNTGSKSDNFFLFVAEVNTAPTIFDQTMRVAASAVNGTVVGTVVGSDPNGGDTLTYEMLNDNSGGFAISDSGVITVADMSALVDGTAVVLTVGVTDSGTPQLSGSGEVTVYVTDAPATAAYSLVAFDAEGNEISSVMPGQDFELRLFATDVRVGLEPDEGGVFSAFADIVYSNGLVSVVGPVDVADLYGAAQSGQVLAPGLIDEVGGVDGITELGTSPQEVARIPMRAGNFEGVARFATDVADDAIQHPTLVFGDTMELTPDLIIFGALSLTVSSNNGSSLMAPPTPTPLSFAAVDSRGAVTLNAQATVVQDGAPLFVAQTNDFGSSWVDNADEQEYESVSDLLFAELGSDL